MPQLDGLRAVAVVFVMVAHFCPMSWVPTVEPWGPLGVRLFFVLSGFLITGILLRARDRKESEGQSAGAVFRWFYARRTLRIFPVFYLVLFVVALGNITGVRDGFWWHVTYVSNFFFASRGDWHGRSSHFWSLAVEEQFYLIWPLLILMAAKRWQLPLIVTAIVAAPLSRLAGLVGGWNGITVSVLPWGCLDTLGAGALLAWCWHRGTAAGKVWRRTMRRVAAISFPILLGLLVYRTVAGESAATILLIDLASAVACLTVVDAAARGISGTWGKLLSASPVRYFGRISYSMYVIHNFMPHFVKAAFLGLGFGWVTPVSSPVQTVWLFLASFPAAMFLYTVVEMPMNRVKSQVRFPRPAAPVVPVVAVSEGGVQ
jgi:peptidoglycan/LPS O-acetylase OafA/YrhL